MIYFATGNNNKFAEAKAIIPELEQLVLDLHEIQSLDPREVIEHKLNDAAKHCAEPLVVEDVSFQLECLKNLPGTLIKWFEKTLGAEGIADLTHRYDNHRATASVMLGYRAKNGETKFFEGSVHGKVVKFSGARHFGFDQIFQPGGFDKTYGEMTPAGKNTVSHRAVAFRKLKEYIDHAHNSS